MNNTDSDLEEGEILDDSSSSPFSNVKELPRRYIIQDHKNNDHKHKKDCKHSIRYHAKKLAKLKKTPIRMKDKKHHNKLCPHEKMHKSSIKCLNDSVLVSKKLNKSNCLSNKIGKKTPLKNNFNINRLSSPTTSIFDQFHSKTENINTSKSNLCEMLVNYKNYNTHSQKINEPNLNADEDSNDVIILESNNENNLSDQIVINNVNGSYESSNVEREESEDEEELRRIALATCAKRNDIAEQSLENGVSYLNNNSAVPESEITLIPISCQDTSNPAFDNYEIVDMEVDEDNQSTFDIADNDDIFVIDTKPSMDCSKDIKSSLSEVKSVENCSDDEFEEDILRAELINSLCGKRSVMEEPMNVEKPLDNLASTQTLKSCERTLVVESTVKNEDNLNKKIDKTIQKPDVNEPPKRLIITLKDESSSDESEQDDSAQLDPVPENPVASIEALISDIRQKSDSCDKNKINVQTVPQAVSCLSKAQQEEYNSLVKILAGKKKNTPASPGKQELKNGVVHSPLEDLKLLEKKLIGVRESLKRKKDVMSCLSKEVNAKKHVYMKSKLSAQHLKEQYVAAEKVRRVKLDAWSKSCRTLDATRKSVTDLEKKIIILQNSCSKMGSSIQGQNYNLPFVTTE